MGAEWTELRINNLQFIFHYVFWLLFEAYALAQLDVHLVAVEIGELVVVECHGREKIIFLILMPIHGMRVHIFATAVQVLQLELRQILLLFVVIILCIAIKIVNMK